MQIGLIADIHADIDTLNRTLHALQVVHRVDLILCAGDLVGYGKQPNEVVDYFRQATIPTVKGNHDSPSDDITAPNADYLRALPFDYRAQFSGTKIYMCHGIPQTNIMGFSPRMLEYESARDTVTDLGVDFVIAGHTHFVFCAPVESTWILNPGSVYAGSQDGTSRTYGILDLQARIFTVRDSVTDDLRAEFELSVKG